MSAPRLRKALAGLAVTAGLAFAVAPVAAQTLASLPAPTIAAASVGAAKPILAWVAFCQGYPAECAVDP
ncbi:transglutaminase-like cysteine peptidase, partial [Methylobacterium sp. J-092]|nr:transglutaminase-like cysteine peptidase [Methylobacterium sp. J-092]